jgi:PAT family beta-lactamase induction signal transducer AmpG
MSSSSRGVLDSLMSRRVLVTFLLGFSSGLPFSLIEGTLQAWLTDAKVSVESVGLFLWVQVPYSLKFFWAPLLDSIRFPFLGRRRGWMAVSQAGLFLSLILLAQFDPGTQPWTVAFISFLVAMISATQDAVVDAHRRESLRDEELGLGTVFFTNGYRVGMIVSAAVPLYLSEWMTWQNIYLVMACCIGLGFLGTLVAPEPVEEHSLLSDRKPWVESFVEPCLQLFKRPSIIALLSFIVLYKVGDSLAAALRTRFLLDAGYDRVVIAEIAKAAGLAASICGAFIGAILLMRIGILRSLMWFGFLQAISTLSFWWLAISPAEAWRLTIAIIAENGTGGMGTSAFVAFMMSICDRRYTATQYAGLSSLVKLPSLAVGSMSGYIVAVIGWAYFFIGCVIAAIPALVILKIYTTRFESVSAMKSGAISKVVE